MKLFILTLFCLLFACSLASSIFPLHQLKIKNYLNRRPVLVQVSSSTDKYSFRSFISRNSRGLLLEVTSPNIPKNDKTGFFKRVAIKNKDQSYPQVLLDFRLISLCRFWNKSPAKHAKQLSFGFEITNRDVKTTITYKVLVMFEGLVRDERLVNDVHEFKKTLRQMRNACQTRKNQLKNRRDWFTSKGDELYDSVKLMKHSHGIHNRFLNANSPLNVDNRIAAELKSHRQVAEKFKSLRTQATKMATYIGGLESQALQLEKDRGDDSTAVSNASRELENAKVHLTLAKEDYAKSHKDLLREVPEERALINEAHDSGNEKDHQNEILKLAINS